MYAVFSVWYIVLALLIVAIAGLFFAFIKMDKKDRILIDEFVNSSEVQPTEQQAEEKPTNENNKE